MKKEFEINSEIYSDDIVKQAISDFKEVSEINFINSKLEVNGNSEGDIDEVFNEFMNYIIGLINE